MDPAAEPADGFWGSKLSSVSGTGCETRLALHALHLGLKNWPNERHLCLEISDNRIAVTVMQTASAIGISNSPPTMAKPLLSSIAELPLQWS